MATSPFRLLVPFRRCHPVQHFHTHAGALASAVKGSEALVTARGGERISLDAEEAALVDCLG